MKRKWIIGVLVIIFLVRIPSVNVYGDTDKFYIRYDGAVHRYKGPFVKLIMDGEEIKTGDMPALIITEEIEGQQYARTLVPVREVCESIQLGATVEWNGEKQEIYISYEDKFIVLKIDDKKAMVNQEEIVLDVPAKIIQDASKKHGKTMVPLRFVVETFGYDIKWDSKTSTATMNKSIASGHTDGNTNDTIHNHTDDNADNHTDDNAHNTTDSHVDEDHDSNNTASENIDTLSSSHAKKTLPTALKDQPVIWRVTDEALSDIGNLYTESVLKKELHPTTNIKSVVYQEDTFKKYFTIKASSAITHAKKIFWDNKLIIDIENARWDMESFEQVFDNNPIITGVRSSQSSFEPDITRVVFDLKGEGYTFDVALAEDRQSIKVSVLSNTIYGIHLGQNNEGDYIKVMGVKSPDVKAFRLKQPDRIVFDLPHSTTLLSTLTSKDVMGQYVKTIRTAQFNEETTRVVVETDGQADFNISKSGEGYTMIQILEPSYSNIQYTNIDNPTIVLDKQGMTMDIGKVTYLNNYLKKEYVITLPGDYSSLFGKGNMNVSDGIMESININNDKGKTQLHIQSNRLYEFRIMEDEHHLYLKAFRPKELYAQIVVVDAGHGGKDPGTIGHGIYEKNPNLDMVLYAKEYLDKNENIKVYYTRLDDTYPTYDERIGLANDVEADFFVSIHNNYFGTEPNGTETHYWRDVDTQGLHSDELADIFQSSLMKQLDTRDRGTKESNFIVLRETHMPSVLLEVAFLSNTEDAKRIKSEAFKKKVGLAVYNAIVQTFDSFPTDR
ncbi:N-acetylmuramoyl-L-alanine amidase [Vallitalea pronyensis]|uniref:N-acetylmuramoyl-L-alanine amidase n=1 Tax=Vallitalea pronyensis TaxID=1348613 RepID=A0A8J8SFJ5_9FIRM|nr:N-acetylmuramoyl-L-alanine amidase family protein [Vallitalea pronyensis]QUI21730.1 N-acetylmuramoyl-L-alanine amidase [Vallitalea pronyensis]